MAITRAFSIIFKTYICLQWCTRIKSWPKSFDVSTFCEIPVGKIDNWEDGEHS